MSIRSSAVLRAAIAIPEPIGTATGQAVRGFVTFKRRFFDHKHAAAAIAANIGEQPRFLLAPVRGDIARGQYGDKQGRALETSAYLFVERVVPSKGMRIEPYRYGVSPADLLRQLIFQMTDKSRNPAAGSLLARRRIDKRLIIDVRIGHEDVVLVFRDKGHAPGTRLNPSTVVDGGGCAMARARSILICRAVPLIDASNPRPLPGMTYAVVRGEPWIRGILRRQANAALRPHSAENGSSGSDTCERLDFTGSDDASFRLLRMQPAACQCRPMAQVWHQRLTINLDYTAKLTSSNQPPTRNRDDGAAALFAPPAAHSTTEVG